MPSDVTKENIRFRENDQIWVLAFHQLFLFILVAGRAVMPRTGVNFKPYKFTEIFMFHRMFNILISNTGHFEQRINPIKGKKKDLQKIEVVMKRPSLLSDALVQLPI